jgi:hypothetical protein
VFPSQHPEQFVELHCAPPVQRPVWQLWPAAWSHVWQKPPLRPHDVLLVPTTQAPVLMPMQPLQGAQAPATQVRPAEHEVHAAPPAPHRAGVVLVMQTPVGVQQP